MIGENIDNRRILEYEAAARVNTVDRLLRDLLNLPGRVETSTHTLNYQYGADGTMLKKTATLSGSHFETETYYAGNLVFQVLDLESILVEGGYIDMTGSTPAYRFYVTDHQGNIRAVTDGSGTVLRTNHYDPYGEEVLPVLTSASTLPSSTAGTDAASRYLYGAKEWDGNLSLYDFSARWYNPAGSVSFTAMDPLCEKYYGISPYAYCYGNPVRYIDPSGLTSYNVNGKFCWINDGMNETISVSEEEFDRISNYYAMRNKSIYNWARRSYMEKNGYIDAEGNSVLPVVVVEAERSSAGFMTFSQMLGLESLLFSGSGEYHYSEMFEKWRGKNGVRYDMSVNGNQYTGGKIKYARNLSRKLQKTGRVISVIGIGTDLYAMQVAKTSEDRIGASLDLIIDAVGLSTRASLLPIVWHFGGKTYYYQFVIPTIESQFESGVLGMPATQPFK